MSSVIDEDTQILYIIERYSPDELCELLGITTEQLVDKFYERCLELEVE